MRARILLVEDNERLAESVSMLLREHGMEVDVVHEGRLVVGIVAHSRPDIVILDVSLPDVSGAVVARSLRLARPKLPIVFATETRGRMICAPPVPIAARSSSRSLSSWKR